MKEFKEIKHEGFITTKVATLYKAAQEGEVIPLAHKYRLCTSNGISTETFEPTFNQDDFVDILFLNKKADGITNAGITNEQVIAMLIDRIETLNSYNNGMYSCHENEIAIESLKTAQKAIKLRTRDRIKRQVAGTHKV